MRVDIHHAPSSTASARAHCLDRHQPYNSNIHTYRVRGGDERAERQALGHGHAVGGVALWTNRKKEDGTIQSIAGYIAFARTHPEPKWHAGG